LKAFCDALNRLAAGDLFVDFSHDIIIWHRSSRFLMGYNGFALMPAIDHSLDLIGVL